MKKKYGLWLNIVTICLCICAVAIGVYAAQTVSLTVSGSVGFTAHDCNANVKVYKYGYASSADDEPIAKANREDCTSSGALQVRGANLTNSSLLGTMYFSDISSTDGKPADIVVDFEITNVSKFNVLAKVNSSTCTNSNVMITYSSAVIMETTGANATAKISVTMSLKGTTSGTTVTYADITTPVSVTLTIGFEKTTNTTSSVKTGTTSAVRKFADTYATQVGSGLGNANCCYDIPYVQTNKTYKNYAQAFPYYIEMGDVNDEPIKWLIVGKKDTDNDAIAKLAEADINAFENGYMLSGVTYCVLSEKGLEERMFHSESSNSTYGTNGNDYATSDIRAYLKSDTFANKYSFSTEELSAITARSIQEMYSTDTLSVSGATEKTLTDGQIFPTSTTATIDTTSDKFWLLSQTEVFKIFEDDTYVCTTDSWKVLMSGRTSEWGNSSGAVSWWLRSPNTNNTNNARNVNNKGYTNNNNVNNGGCAVRADLPQNARMQV